MKPASTLLLMGLVTVAWLPPAAGQDPAKTLPPPSERKDVTYAGDIRPLFEASCFGCHGAERQRAGLRLDSLEAALQGSDEGKVILPGNSKESLLVVAVARIDEELVMPPGRRPGGGFGPGGAFGGPGGGRDRGGRGGPGGREGADPRDAIPLRIFARADADRDQKLTSAELDAMAEAWFDKLDAEKADSVNEDRLASWFEEVLAESTRTVIGPGRGPGGQRGGNDDADFGPGRSAADGLVAAADADKDGSLSRAELKGALSKWFAEWGFEKSGSLTERQFRDGWNASVSRPGFGGPDGFDRRRGNFSPAFFIAPQVFAQADSDKDQRLTKEELGALADAWFDNFDATPEGKLNQEQLGSGLDRVLTPAGPGAAPGRGPRGQRGGDDGRRFGPGRFLGPALLAAADAEKDGSLTRAELRGAFEKWFAEWDAGKNDSLTEEQFRDGWGAALAMAGTGRQGDPGGPGGRFGRRDDRPDGPGRPDGQGGSGGGSDGRSDRPAFGGGPGGGGFGGFGRRMLAREMLSQADADADRKLSRTELVGLAGSWFDRLDGEKAGKLKEEQFLAKLDGVIVAPGRAGPEPDARPPDPGRDAGREAPGAGRRAGPSGTIGPGLFAAADLDRDGSLTRAELEGTFEKWFVQWDSEKSGSLDEEKLYAGLSAAIPQARFGGVGGPGGLGGPGGFGGRGPGGGFGDGAGPAPKPLTAEQVGLIRAWIDDGAK